MEGTGRRSALMNHILLKAGIPFVVALGAFIYSVTKNRRKFEIEGSSSRAKASCDESDCQEFRDQESCQEEEEKEKFIENAHIMNSFRSFQSQDSYLEEEIFHLMNQVRALQDREQELEKRFVGYCDLKEQESVLMKLQNMLALETAHVEFLGVMIESIEAEKQRLEDLAVAYLRVVEQLQSARRENGFLQKKVKKLSRSTGEQYRLLSQQTLVLQDRDAELLTSRKELERREEIIKESQDEIMKLKRIVDQMEEEKNDLVEKLELAEAPAPSTSKTEEEEKTMEDQSQLLAELEQLRKDRATDSEELIYLRWVNACLKHEFMRYQQQPIFDHEMGDLGAHPGLIFEEQDEKREQKLEYDSDNLSTVSEHAELRTSIVTAGHKKQKVLKKLRKWMKGNEGCRRSCDVKDSKDQDARRFSTSDGPTEQHPAPRASWASV